MLAFDGNRDVQKMTVHLTSQPDPHEPRLPLPRLTGLSGIAFVVAGLATDHAPTSSRPGVPIEQWYTILVGADLYSAVPQP